MEWSGFVACQESMIDDYQIARAVLDLHYMPKCTIWFVNIGNNFEMPGVDDNDLTQVAY